MPRDLDIDLLRTFLAIVEDGGFARAGDRLGRTQSAVSLQMRRLQGAAGKPLFAKAGRRAVLTPDGELLLGYAKRLLALHEEARARFRAPEIEGLVRLGTPEDFATTHLPGVLASFAAAHPRVALDVRCDFTRSLEAGYASGAFDLMLVKREPRPGEPGRGVWRERLVWAAASGFTAPPGPLPLVLSPPPDVYRDRALAALDAAGVAWRVTYVSASLAGLHAAVRAGLGVSVLTRDMVPAGIEIPMLPLPDLADTEICLRHAQDAAPATLALSTHIARAFERRAGGRP